MSLAFRTDISPLLQQLATAREKGSILAQLSSLSHEAVSAKWEEWSVLLKMPLSLSNSISSGLVALAGAYMTGHSLFPSDSIDSQRLHLLVESVNVGPWFLAVNERIETSLSLSKDVASTLRSVTEDLQEEIVALGFLESCVSFCASNAAIRLVSDELSNCAFAMFDCALLRTRALLAAVKQLQLQSAHEVGDVLLLINVRYKRASALFHNFLASLAKLEPATAHASSLVHTLINCFHLCQQSCGRGSVSNQPKHELDFVLLSMSWKWFGRLLAVCGPALLHHTPVRAATEELVTNVLAFLEQEVCARFQELESLFTTPAEPVSSLIAERSFKLIRFFLSLVKSFTQHVPFPSVVASAFKSLLRAFITFFSTVIARSSYYAFEERSTLCKQLSVHIIPIVCALGASFPTFDEQQPSVNPSDLLVAVFSCAFVDASKVQCGDEGGAASLAMAKLLTLCGIFKQLDLCFTAASGGMLSLLSGRLLPIAPSMVAACTPLIIHPTFACFSAAMSVPSLGSDREDPPNLVCPPEESQSCDRKPLFSILASSFGTFAQLCSRDIAAFRRLQLFLWEHVFHPHPLVYALIRSMWCYLLHTCNGSVQTALLATIRQLLADESDPGRVGRLKSLLCALSPSFSKTDIAAQISSGASAISQAARTSCFEFKPNTSFSECVYVESLGSISEDDDLYFESIRSICIHSVNFLEALLSSPHSCTSACPSLIFPDSTMTADVKLGGESCVFAESKECLAVSRCICLARELIPYFNPQEMLRLLSSLQRCFAVLLPSRIWLARFLGNCGAISSRCRGSAVDHYVACAPLLKSLFCDILCTSGANDTDSVQGLVFSEAMVSFVHFASAAVAEPVQPDAVFANHVQSQLEEYLPPPTHKAHPRCMSFLDLNSRVHSALGNSNGKDFLLEHPLAASSASLELLSSECSHLCDVYTRSSPAAEGAAVLSRALSMLQSDPTFLAMNIAAPYSQGAKIESGAMLLAYLKQIVR